MASGQSIGSKQMISGRNKSIWNNWTKPIDDKWKTYNKDEDELSYDLKSSLNEIWDWDVSDNEWMKTMIKPSGSGIPKGYYTPDPVYPAVAIGDLVQLKETDLISVVTNIADNGMGDDVYCIHQPDDFAVWVSRAQIRKVL